jgi:ABC-type lipoprotein release transport system permease subunit
MALGAPSAQILRGFLWEGLRLATAGVVLGVALSVAATRLLASLLFEVKPIDPPTLAAAAALVVTVTLGGSYVPARRASLVHPMAALRQE